MRQDLLALTLDDLVSLSNRGIVKRSQQEVQSGQFTYELAEDEHGNVTVHWSDPVDCYLPSDRTLSNSQCSCPATTLCRHLIRSVLVYQQTQNSQPPASSTASSSPTSTPAPPPVSPWNPGDLSDTVLAQHFKKATLSKLKTQFDAGHVISLTRSHKPSAHLHTLSCTVRFLVAGDVRYTHCDCAEPTPCSHVPLAIWAFRLLEEGQSSGIVSTRATAYPVPTALLDDLEQHLQQLAQVGMARFSEALRDRCRRLELQCREAGLTWLAEILAELLQEYSCYTQHDARFSPQHVVELIGELCIRSDAMRHDTGRVPQLFIRGSVSDRTIDIGSTRLIGLGCGAQLKQQGVELTTYCQDVDSGTIVAICRTFPDPPPDSTETTRDLYQLAQTPALKGVSFAQLGTGQLVVKGGKRTPSYQFLPGRTPISFNPQAYQWESLRAPALVEDFTELSTHLSTLPPASLRPRRLTENLHVCQVATVEDVTFNATEQAVLATLRDRQGNGMSLCHPYMARGRQGTESLLTTLSQHPETIRFVAGQVRFSRQGVVIAPVSLILEQDNGRTMLQPWVDREIGKWEKRQDEAAFEQMALSADAPVLPHVHYLQQLADALSDLFLVGLQRVDSQTIRYWQDLDRLGAAIGFVRFMQPIQQLATALARKSTMLQWDGQSAAMAMLTIAVLLKLAQEQLGNDTGR